MASDSFNIGHLPKSIQQSIRENLPNPASWSPELKALLDPNIEARRTNLPNAGQIQIVNREYVYYWARRIQGKSADHNNYLKLRYAGYTNATCDPKCEDESGQCKCDVHPIMAEVAGNGEEITLGPDLVLVKARPDVHYGRMKVYIQRAINMTNPQRQEGLGAMTSALTPDDKASLSATRTYVPGDNEREEMNRRATRDNSVRQGTPAWEEIAAPKNKKKGE